VLDHVAQWRISDLVRFYESGLSEPAARARIDEIVFSELRREATQTELSNDIFPFSFSTLEAVRKRANERLSEFALKVTSLRIKTMESPGAPGLGEKSFQAAVKEAERFGLQDPRLATSLNNLASLYHRQGKYTEAEPLYKRSLTIWEKTLALLAKVSEHPNPNWPTILNVLDGLHQAQGKYDVARILDNYALLLRKTNHEAEAAKMEVRAKAIRAKHKQRNPMK